MIDQEVIQPTAEVLGEIEDRVNRYEELVMACGGNPLNAACVAQLGVPRFTYEDVAFLLNLLRATSQALDDASQALCAQSDHETTTGELMP
jgi:hypothetical protein